MVRPVEEMFGKLKERREAKHRERLQHDYERADASWNEDDEFMSTCIDTAQSFRGGGDPFADKAPASVHHGERVVAVAQGVGLVEPKRLPGQWQGGYSGFSFRIAKGIRYNVGGTRGHFVQGAEVITPVDVGDALVTDRRVAFTGKLKAREWQFAKLLGIHHDPDVARTYLPVSNREAVSGIAYPGSGAPELRFRISLAVALFNDKLDEFVDELMRERQAHQAERPTAPPLALVAQAVAAPPPAAPPMTASSPNDTQAPAPGAGSYAERPPAVPTETVPSPNDTQAAASPGAGWYPDPSGKHAWRYYDGATWTSAVSNGGSVASDT